MNKNTRFEVRTPADRRKRASVIVKQGYSSSTEVVKTFTVANNADTLVEVANWAKAQGAQGVNWGACSSNYWVGFSF